jgi:GNAT superfamily N-acetyltransferase
MTDIVIRTSRPGDGEKCAELWRETGGLFAEMNPHIFRVPAAEGLAEWFEELNAKRQDAKDRVLLIAEIDGVLAGIVGAALEEPLDPNGRELQTDLNLRRMHIGVLAVVGAHRRSGVGTALMGAAEEWGRERGAEVVTLETETNNPMSVPFYEERMGFSAQAFVFRKDLRE